MHTPHCLDIQKKIEFQNHWYMTAYPSHCSCCGGSGGYWTRYDPSGAGVSLSVGYLSDFEYCDECVMQEVCPRCGEQIDWIETESRLMNDYFLCSHCCWSDRGDIPKGLSGMDYECDCWEIGVKGL